MKLYYCETLAPRKACAVARLLKSPVEFVRVDLGTGEHKRPEYRAINPNGKVPALVDGDLKLWEADAIMLHLAVKAGSDLWPSKPEEQVEVTRWLSWSAQELTPQTGTLYFEHIIKTQFGLGPVDADEEAKAIKASRRLLAVLDAHLTERRYLVGDRLTIADFAVASTLPYAERSNIPLGEFANVKRWHDRLNELEAWREPFPARAAAAA
jgi:glutathione S-transferase